MKPIYHFSALILTLMCLSFPGFAAKGLSEADAQTFLHDSGLDALIDSLAPTMEQQLNMQRLTQANQLQFAEAEDAIKQAINNIQGNELALNYLTTEADSKNLKAAMQFLASPLGRRIAVEEREASSPQAQLEMQAYAMQMAKTPPSEQRIELIQSLADALNADQVILSLMKGIFFTLVDVTEGLTPDASAGLKADLEAEWQQMEPMLSGQFRQFMVMGSHYSYRNLSDDDLKSYIDFLNTESGQAYWMAGLKIVDIYLQAFAQELVAIIKQQKV
jgi:hypothetical protein